MDGLGIRLSYSRWEVVTPEDNETNDYYSDLFFFTMTNWFIAHAKSEEDHFPSN